MWSLPKPRSRRGTTSADRPKVPSSKWLLPQLNARIGLQYVINDKFDGGRTNFDGRGRNASDNNTLFLYAWIAF
jgi:hypothetical protein